MWFVLAHRDAEELVAYGTGALITAANLMLTGALKRLLHHEHEAMRLRLKISPLVIGRNPISRCACSLIAAVQWAVSV